jgi:uncharacterized membrane protein YhaH (DUF805 family)
MEGEQKTEGASAESGQVNQDTQQAKQELKQVADRAKAATAGFSFEKLFAGRLDQMNYFWFFVASIVAGTVLSMIPLVGAIVCLALGVVGLGATARRLHDIGQTGWYALAFVIPPIGILLALYLCWKHGSTTANIYGDAPDPKRDIFKAVLNT